MNNKKLYNICNIIIYILIALLIIIISYNLLILYKIYNTPKIPHNSINVSPKYTEDASDVLLDN